MRSTFVAIIIYIFAAAAMMALTMTARDTLVWATVQLIAMYG